MNKKVFLILFAPAVITGLILSYGFWCFDHMSSSACPALAVAPLYALLFVADLIGQPIGSGVERVTNWKGIGTSVTAGIDFIIAFSIIFVCIWALTTVVCVRFQKNAEQ